MCVKWKTDTKNGEVVVYFDEQSVKNYLDHCIGLWREFKDQEDKREMAVYYIDAFQSVRASLFGETLPLEAGEAPKKGDTRIRKVFEGLPGEFEITEVFDGERWEEPFNPNDVPRELR